ncbi:hypothetical protein LNP74_29615 [Klebsiella pneumoniae subsp. pneumoniae]|nr:hypothetical protein [Klebsiella pneumoniae subsp. pneumoniae]
MQMNHADAPATGIADEAWLKVGRLGRHGKVISAPTSADRVNPGRRSI